MKISIRSWNIWQNDTRQPIYPCQKLLLKLRIYVNIANECAIILEMITEKKTKRQRDKKANRIKIMNVINLVAVQSL